MPSKLDPNGQARIVCFTNALAAMRHHYGTVLGLEVLEIFEGDHGLRLRLRGDTEVQLINAEDGPTNGCRLSVQVASADETYAQVSAVALGEPTDTPYGHRSFTTVDPDGNPMAIFEILTSSHPH
jgi:hypothetical protein